MRACHPFVCVTSKAVRPGMKKDCRSVGNNKKGEKKEKKKGKRSSPASLSCLIIRMNTALFGRRHTHTAIS